MVLNIMNKTNSSLNSKESIGLNFRLGKQKNISYKHTEGLLNMSFYNLKKEKSNINLFEFINQDSQKHLTKPYLYKTNILSHEQSLSF